MTSTSKEAIRVADPPSRPLMLFDGECGFCRAWIERWKQWTDGRVDYAPSQEARMRFPEIPAGEFRRAVQLVMPDGEVLSGARAVAVTLDVAGRHGALFLYERVPGGAAVMEAAYGAVARHRGPASWLTRVLWGGDVRAPSYGAASTLFLRLLGVVFLIAFLSLWVQIDGLIGSRGILPIADLLALARERLGPERYWIFPTAAWLASSDAALHAFCAAGALLSILLAAGFYPAVCAAGATALYLSISVAGQAFFQFQWDILLVEAGFLAVLLAPLGRRIRWPAGGPSRMALFLLRWLVFRLYFSSGVVKLASGDPEWRSLSALTHHYETQPLPAWTSWYAHQIDGGAHRVSALLLLTVELAAPFLAFGPRRLRAAAFALLVALQAVIAATGNYAFFNLLSALLCVILLDDGQLAGLKDRLRRLVRRPKRELAPEMASPASRSSPRVHLWPRAVLVPIGAFLILMGFVELAASAGRAGALPGPVVAAARVVSPFRIVNGYGLFAVMTARRPEITIEGSVDGKRWVPYEFRWKPGDVRRRPRFVAPYQPRLDWQMWFAALGRYEDDPWFARLESRLLEGSPEVLSLLAGNPFPDGPPRFVRARLWDYRFTTPAERREAGAWWRRTEIGEYGPVVARE